MRATANLRSFARFTCIFVEYSAAATIFVGRVGEAWEAQAFLPARSKLAAGKERVAGSKQDLAERDLLRARQVRRQLQ